MTTRTTPNRTPLDDGILDAAAAATSARAPRSERGSIRYLGLTKAGEHRYVVRHGVGKHRPSYNVRARDKKAALKLAKDKLDELLALRATGKLRQTTRLRTREWIGPDGEYWRLWSGHLAPRTKEKQKESVRLYLTPALLETKLKDLTPALIQHRLNEMRASGLSFGTTDFFYRVLRATLNVAVEKGLISENPAKKLNRGQRSNRNDTKHDYTAPEIRQFLDAAKDHPLCALFTLAIEIGMRPGELYALRWTDVDMRVGQITVRQAMYRLRGKGNNYAFKEPKTGRSRTFPVPQASLRALREHLARQNEIKRLAGRDYIDKGLVFATHNGLPLFHANVTRAYRKLIDKAKLPYLRPYALRHTATNLMEEAGVPIKAVQEILGHSRIQTTLDVYSHVHPDMMKRAAELIDRHLDSSATAASTSGQSLGDRVERPRRLRITNAPARNPLRERLRRFRLGR